MACAFGTGFWRLLVDVATLEGSLLVLLFAVLATAEERTDDETGTTAIVGAGMGREVGEKQNSRSLKTLSQCVNSFSENLLVS